MLSRLLRVRFAAPPGGLAALTGRVLVFPLEQPQGVDELSEQLAAAAAAAEAEVRASAPLTKPGAFATSSCCLLRRHALCPVSNRIAPSVRLIL